MSKYPGITTKGDRKKPSQGIPFNLIGEIHIRTHKQCCIDKADDKDP
jgi:hypothetical protein